MNLQHSKELKLFSKIDNLLNKKIVHIDLEKHFNKVEEDLEEYDDISILRWKQQVFKNLNKNDLDKIFNMADKYNKSVDVIVVGLCNI